MCLDQTSDPSAVPGDPGPAVFAGHVDTRRGPAVFAPLDRLRKDTVPTERISTTPQLRLLTCGGPFDEGTLSYQDNVVVFASAR